MSLASGVRLGPYLVGDSIGAGGMGEVYRARDTRLDREVALKRLPDAFAREPTRLARFEREAKLLASLSHPNIATLFGLEDVEGERFITMELVPGEDLAARFKEGPVPLDEALPIARQVAEALEQAHERGIVHRDLKPANVKLTPDHKVKVLDFGLAKALGGDAPVLASGSDVSESPTLAHAGTAAGLILGTAAYMSPEQARGRAVDKRTDIWAFGVLLYEMLSGRRLFEGETVSDTLAAVLRQEVDWAALPADTPPRLQALLRRCLVRDPHGRLRDIGDARIELQELQAASAVVGAPGSGAWSGAIDLAQSAGRPGGRTLIAGLSLVLLGAAVGALSAWLLRRPAPATPVRFSITPPGESGRVKHLRVSSDGRRVVYGLESEPGLIVQELARFESRRLPGSEGGVRPFLSPDGRSVGFFQAGKLRRLAFDGGDPTDVCEAPESSPGAAWGSNGVILFSPAWVGSGLWRVDAAGGRPVQVTKPDRARGETGHFWADFLPDGRAALFTIFGGQGFADSKVGLLDLDSGRYQALFDGAAPRYVASGHVVYYRAGVYRAVPFDAARRAASGPETTILPDVRRLHPGGGDENYLDVAQSGVVVYVEGESTLNEPPSRLAWVARDGRLEALPVEGNHGELSLSPDGARVAVVRHIAGQSQIFVHDLERGTSEQLTRSGYYNFEPAFHPDGRSVAFSSLADGSFDIRSVPADGSAAPRALRATELDEALWQWAPDGESAVFQVWSPLTATDIWRHNARDGEAAPLIATPLAESGARISPDGRFIAYLSGQALYVSAYPSLAERVLIAPAAGEPRWSPSTPELFFVAESRMQVVRYGVETGAFKAAAAARLFDAGDFGTEFEVAPDGRRFLVRVPLPGRPRRDLIRVVLNGFDLVRGEPASR